MAMTAAKLDSQVLADLKNLSWGTDLKDDVFTRWSQGTFYVRSQGTSSSA